MSILSANDLYMGFLNKGSVAMVQFKFCHIISVALSLMALLIQPTQAAQTVLIGGDLNICRSDQVTNCTNKKAFSDNAFSKKQYDLNGRQLAELSKSIEAFPQYQSASLTKLIQFLSQPARLPKRTGLSESDIRVAALKQIPTTFRQLTHGQWQLVLDHLESIPKQKRFLQSSTAKTKEVSLKHTEDDFSVRALRSVVDELNGDNLLIVTAANSDVFEDVVWLIDAFDQLDINAEWLPLEGAISQRIVDNLDEEKREQACNRLDQFRAEVTGRFNRGLIYPKLQEQALDHCLNPDENQELIDEADGVLFWGDNPVTLGLALTNGNGEPSKEWQKILQKHNKGKLLIAANGGAVHAFSNKGERAGALISGDSHKALLKGISFMSANQTWSYPNPSQTALMLTPPNNTAGTLNLGLFNNIIFDTEFSNKGNQGRLLSLITQSRPAYAIGIDSRTIAKIDQKDDTLTISVTGEGGVSLFDNKAIKISTLVPVQSEKVVMNYLTPGDSAMISPTEMTIDFADWKYSSSHYGQSVVKGGQAFKSDNFFKTLYMLCSTGGNVATLKHIELGQGHQIKVKKQPRSASVNGSQNINGKNYRYCSFRGYELATKVLL